MPYYESMFGGGKDYSTSEVKTDKRWIDGKPVYRKVVTIKVTTSGESYVNHGIANIETPISGDFYLQGFGVLPYVPAAGLAWIRSCVFRRDNVLCNFGSSASLPATITATLEYTKTTD